MTKNEFMFKLNSILSQLDFDVEAKHDALKYIPAHYGYISKAAKEAYILDDDSDPIKKRKPHTKLMILIFKMVELSDTYKEKGLPENVILDTLSDVTLRQRLYKMMHGKLGLSDEDIMWLKRIYQLKIFKLGALQFEITDMKYVKWKGIKYIEGVSELIPEGVPTLNVHIRRGVDFSRDAVDSSFQRAESFFAEHFPGHDFVAYTCNSWMLYPGNEAFLAPTSNILDFAARFQLIGEATDKDMAIKYIYFKRYRYKKDYPQETSLQRKVLGSFNKLGAGCGIIWREKTL
ncbi:carbohydrate ABC transporter substrate-bindin g protein, CUT1 family (plasmid) [Peptoclostridium acidaminophilum DSM 3953]|uniref:Carbohydrate ABC transporter substrate-bindin g protein, CUT1 family n=1 Tax=Peptoclostridium acidaminophilum DSM 3953 TaxID=1286171 RepID=W8TJC7_PEPAC|nr:acyltransferase domain-containing protein [Peptoclostridium acidaminophilum]AHM57893.1 carbohydrate ABC transporter substrate-bindin g protein, CUT1 family [Peptoclostridium acidaminophilum DSM 3953]